MMTATFAGNTRFGNGAAPAMQHTAKFGNTDHQHSAKFGNGMPQAHTAKFGSAEHETHFKGARLNKLA